MRLVYKIYPAVLWALCLLFWAAGITLTVVLDRPWSLVLWPIPAGLLAWVLAGVLTISFPRIRYVNNAEINGLGYVHQPFDVLVPFWIISFLVAVVANWSCG
jgi:hypothetical protein